MRWPLAAIPVSFVSFLSCLLTIMQSVPAVLRFDFLAIQMHNTGVLLQSCIVFASLSTACTKLRLIVNVAAVKDDHAITGSIFALSWWIINTCHWQSVATSMTYAHNLLLESDGTGNAALG